MGHIFISYSTNNGEYADKLADKLRAEGFDVWIDNARLRSSDNWWESIVLALNNCAAVIVIMTPEAKKSRWVQREITLADNWQKPIFPILLSGENWELFVLTQYEDVSQHAAKTPQHGSKLPSRAFFEKLAQDVPRQKTPGTNVTDKSEQSGTPVKPDVAVEIAHPPPADIPPVRAIIRAAIIGGLFLLAATIIVLIFSTVREGQSLAATETAGAVVLLNASSSQTAAALVPTVTETLTTTPSFTPSPSETPTDLPTDTPSSTSTLTGTPTATATPTKTPTPSDTPTHTPEPSATTPIPSPTATLQITATSVGPSYPCDAVIIYNRTASLNVVRGGPSGKSSFRSPIEQGAAIRILSKDRETQDIFWYHIADSNGEELGWISPIYVILSDSCPEE